MPVDEMRPWLAVAVLMIGLQFLPVEWRDLLRFDRDALAAGEAWRALSANFVHLGWYHLALNVTAFLVIGWLFADEATTGWWLAALVASGVASSAGMYWWTPDAVWVVGMSGALHGLFLFGAMCWIDGGFRIGWGLLAGVAGKLLWEQAAGAMPFSEGLVGGPVITDAHLWGAIGGAGIGLIRAFWRRSNPRL